MEPFEPRADSARRGDGISRLDRMREGTVAPQPRPQRAVVAWALTAALLAFALGLIANPWFERSVRSRLPGFAPTLAPTVAEVSALQARVAALEARPRGAIAAPAAEVAGERLARLEAKAGSAATALETTTVRTDKVATDLATLTGRIEGTAAATAAALTAATAAADRAQAMLVLVSARRAIDGGTRLGALEPALRRGYGVRAPAAVEAIAALGAAPVTPASLRAGLERLRPSLTGSSAAPGAARDWWTGLRETLAGVVIRPATATTDPAARVDRAVRALVANNVAAAAAEIAALPAAPRAIAAGWLASAERYQAGERGLAMLEASQLDPLPPAPLLSPTGR